eukprot:1267784-Alexandrium_andersonii.AAC.1
MNPSAGEALSGTAQGSEPVPHGRDPRPPLPDRAPCHAPFCQPPPARLGRSRLMGPTLLGRP